MAAVESNMKSDRIPELDALRGLAAVAVLLFHYSTGFERTYQFTQAQPFDFRFGYLGVQLFFVVSGFVIFLTLERTQRPLDFAFSRFSRLYPTFWAGVLITTAVVTLARLPHAERTATEVLINLTMLQEFFGVRSVDGVYWTLTRELVFYGWVLAVFTLGWIKHWVPLAYAWLSFQFVANQAERFYGWFPWKLEFYFLTEYCHLFVAGIAFYRIYRKLDLKASCGLLLFAGVNHFCLTDRGLPVSRWMEGVIVVLFFALMFAVVKGRARFLANRPLVFLGTISYALYLTHQFLGYAVIRYFDAAGLSLWVAIGVSSTLSVTLAALVTGYIEKPATRWLRNCYFDWRTTRRDVVGAATSQEVVVGVQHASNKKTRLDSRPEGGIEPTKKKADSLAGLSTKLD